jgi:hypothetical protein
MDQPMPTPPSASWEVERDETAERRRSVPEMSGSGPTLDQSLVIVRP